MEDNIPVSATAGSEAALLLIDLVPDLTGGLLSENFNVPVRGYAAAAHTLKMVELIVEGETIGRAVYGKPEQTVLAELPNGMKVAQYAFEFNLQRSKGNADGLCCLTIRAVTNNGFVQEEPFELMLAPTDHLPVRRLSGPVQRLKNYGSALPPPILLCVDRAVIDANGTLLLQGWSLAMEPIVSIQVRLGDERILNARLGYQRDDAAMHHGAYPNARTAGFALASQLSEDERCATTSLCVQTIAANGLSQEMVLPIATSSRPEQLSEALRQQQIIHYFWDEANVTSLGELHVEGWAVCSIGIAKVAVYLDGKCLGEAVLGLPRPDVGLQFEAIPMARFAGFRFHQSLPGLAAGHHPKGGS